MKIYKFIKILAELCRYNANCEIYLHINGENIKLNHAIEDKINNKEVLILVSEKDKNYYGN